LSTNIVKCKIIALYQIVLIIKRLKTRYVLTKWGKKFSRSFGSMSNRVDGQDYW